MGTIMLCIMAIALIVALLVGAILCCGVAIVALAWKVLVAIFIGWVLIKLVKTIFG